jgi:hypothetical protein
MDLQATLGRRVTLSKGYRHSVAINVMDPWLTGTAKGAFFLDIVEEGLRSALGYRTEDIHMFCQFANRNGDNALSHQVPRLLPVPGFNVRQLAQTRLAEFLAAFKMNARNRSP